ncbi:MAG: DUF424 family protein [Nanoarchaeota archaeon]
MFVKIHQAYRVIIAVADSDLIGKRFEESNRQIDVRANFFAGEEMSEKELIAFLQDMHTEDATFNIIGKQSVSAAVKSGVIKEEGIFYIDGVPVALGLL